MGLQFFLTLIRFVNWSTILGKTETHRSYYFCEICMVAMQLIKLWLLWQNAQG